MYFWTNVGRTVCGWSSWYLSSGMAPLNYQLVFVLAGRVSIRERLHPCGHQCWPLHGHHVATQTPNEQTACQGDYWYCVAGGTGDSSAYPAAVKPEPTEPLVQRVWQVCLRRELGQPALPLLLHVSPCWLLSSTLIWNRNPTF